MPELFQDLCFTGKKTETRVALTSVQIKSEFLHSVRMAVFAEALNTEIKIVADCAMVASLNTLCTVVASVDKFIL